MLCVFNVPMTVRELDANELATWLARGERLRLIDVRTPAEVARGAIPAAENLPLHLLPSHADALPVDPKVVFYCRSGARSAQACVFMKTRGREEVYNLKGGINAWLRHGLPVGPPLPPG
ncbi:MAG: rhodanese-like domain-containing protein [Gammaproteobacteria bacterium]|nr:rhodanese-like domain-containing protein [Gammaproteobacteria bacterium]